MLEDRFPSQIVRGVRESSVGKAECQGPAAGNSGPDARMYILPGAGPFDQETRLIEWKCS
jgi:hypothetical protein